MNDLFLNLERQVSSARQMHDMLEPLRREAEAKTIKRMGAEAQIESSKILANQAEELVVMRKTINDLLLHTLEQAKQYAIASQERDKVETARYRENLRFTKIAAWTGVIGIIFSAVAILLELHS